MKLSQRLVTSLGLGDVLQAAETRRGDFFPSRLAYQAARASNRYVAALTRRLTSNYQPSAAEVVEVPKWSGGTRPAADLALNDRLVYDGLIGYLKSKVVTGLVNVSPSHDERPTAERVLTEGDHSYVLVADIASFYEFIRHDILSAELVDLTGEAEAVEALGELLSGTLQQTAGLPQGPPSSGYLADVYASIADRNLMRSGHHVVRFSDDYRVPANSWRQAIQIQIRLEQALRAVGLTINSAKTRTPSRELYSEWLAGRTDQAELPDLDNEATPAADQGDEERPAWWPPYLDYDPGEQLAPLAPPDPQVVARYERIIGDPGFWGDAPNAERSYRLIPLLYQVATFDSNHMTESLPTLLQHFPHLTREVTLSLRRRLGTFREGEAIEAVRVALTHPHYLFSWQRGFLFHAVIPATETLPDDVATEAKAELNNQAAPWFSRGRAGLALATEHLVDIDDTFRGIFDAAPTATKVDLLGIAAAETAATPAAAALLAAEGRGALFEGLPEVIARWERRYW